MIETVERRHLSASTLADLQICERRWAYSRGLDPNVPQPPPNPYLVLGQALHGAIRAWYERGDISDANDAVGEVLSEAVGLGADIALAGMHTYGLFDQFLRWQATTGWIPTHQEGERIFEFEGERYVAYIDAHDEIIGRDWKSARKLWDYKKQKDGWLQATTYYVATGIREWEYVIFHYEQLLKGRYSTPGYGYQTVTHMVSDADVERLRALTKVYGELVQRTDISEFPIRPMSMNWLCRDPREVSWGGCPFWDHCPGGGGT